MAPIIFPLNCSVLALGDIVLLELNSKGGEGGRYGHLQNELASRNRQLKVHCELSGNPVEGNRHVE